MDAIEALKLIEDWEDAREKQLELHLAFQSHEQGPKRGDPACREYWEAYDAVIAPEIEPLVHLLKSVIALGATEGLQDHIPMVQKNLEARIRNIDAVERRLNLLISQYGASSNGRMIN